MSRRNQELLFLLLAGAVSTMAYVSVYASRFREIDTVAVVHALAFVGIFLLLHIVERLLLPQADPFLLPLTALLVAVGLTEIFRIKPALALVQGQWLLVGAGLFIATVVLVRDHMRLDRYRYLIGAVGLALLVATIVVGTTVRGARLWIHAFGFSIQPSEFAKLAIVVFLAGYLDDKKVLLSVPQRHLLGVPVPAFKYFGPLLVMWALSLAMLVFMKDFGMALLFMSIFVALMYMATARGVYVLAGAGLFAAAGAIALNVVPHVQDRFRVWLDPWPYAETTGYQLLQSLFTIADGGILGAGIGRGYLLFPDKTPVVPDLQTDFIFTAVANEMGLLGAVGVILVYLLFVWCGFRIAVYAPDGFSKLLAAGLAAAFALQTFIIIGGVTRVIPLTGITLPFVSYGGSSITANLMLVALLLMVSNRTNILRGGTELERRRLAERGEGMNRAMSRVFTVAALLFVVLVVNLTWLMAVRADWFRARPENKRSIAKEMKIKRGDILGFDGSVMAGTVRRSGYYYRAYPGGTLAPQLIGYDSVRYGRSGIEARFNDELTGQATGLGVQNWVDKLLGRRPKGAHLKLTIVPDVQRVAQAELDGKKGAVVALDPTTGALIASASAPSYDLSGLEDHWARLSEDPGAPLLNRPTQGLYVPGSSFKVVTASGGLDSGKVTPQTKFVDTGTYVVFGGKVTNYGGAVYGPNDFTTAMTLSINTTFAKVGNRLGRTRLIASAEHYGFYQTPPLELPAGEVVPSGRYGKKGLLKPDAFMDPLDVAWAACGQEKMLATPLQMALVAGGVANGGRVMKPYVVQEVVASDGQVVRTTRPEQWLEATGAATADQLNVMMQRVVTSGTATAAALEGIEVAGKTGTAEKGDGTNLAWFIGFAPADDPRVAVAVVVEDTLSTGGEAAAPLAAAVLKAALTQTDLP